MKVNGKSAEIDMVNHPQHYQSESGLEVIDVIEAFTSNLTGIEAVCTANIIKYICRWKQKNGLEDLKKARWYLDHLIDHVEDTNDDAETGWIFETRDAAEDAVAKMCDLIEQHGVATISDLQDMRGNLGPFSYDGDKYGWTDVECGSIKKIKDYGYLLRLPAAESLCD